MKLTDLDPRFIWYETRVEPTTRIVGDAATWRERGSPTMEVVTPVHRIHQMATLGEAQGLQFLCPKCFADNGGEVGTHWIDVSFEGRGVQPDEGAHGSNGDPTRWEVSGSGFADLTTRPSILVVGGCGWHGFITNGEVT